MGILSISRLIVVLGRFRLFIGIFGYEPEHGCREKQGHRQPPKERLPLFAFVKACFYTFPAFAGGRLAFVFVAIA